MPHDLPRWDAVYGQAMRWMRAGCFDALAQDLRAVLRMAGERAPEPSAAVLDSRTRPSTPGSGARAGHDGAKRKRGSKVHLAVDTLGHLLALHASAADASDRDAVERLAQEVQEAAGGSVEVAYVDQGYAGEKPAAAAAAHGIRLEAVRLPEAKRGFVLLPRRWVVGRSFAWATRRRRLVHDYERLAQTLAGMHTVAFSMLMLKKASDLAQIRNTLQGEVQLGACRHQGELARSALRLQQDIGSLGGFVLRAGLAPQERHRLPGRARSAARRGVSRMFSQHSAVSAASPGR